jgi:hypothetical protein
MCLLLLLSVTVTVTVCYCYCYCYCLLLLLSVTVLADILMSSYFYVIYENRISWNQIKLIRT